MLLECINTSVWNLFIIPEEDWSQSKSIEEYEVNKLKNGDGYSCFYAFVQLPAMDTLPKLYNKIYPQNLNPLNSFYILSSFSAALSFTNALHKKE